MFVTWLLVIRGNDKGRRYKLAPGSTVTIGREKTNVVRLADEEVSRQHAEIKIVDDSIEIVDLQSSNGTFVNGEKIETVSLNKGDHVKIGQTSFLLTVASSELGRLSSKIHGSSSSLFDEDANVESDDASFVEELGSDLWVSSVKSNLDFMYGAAIATGRTSEVNQMLERILDLIFDWINVDRGCILLWESKSEKYKPRATRYRTTEAKNVELKISKSIIKYVSEQKEGVLTSNFSDFDQQRKNFLMDGVQEAICVPINGRAITHGFIYADRLSRDPEVDSAKPQFNEDHLKLIVAIGHQVAVFIENDEYYSALVESERLTAVGQTLATLSHHIKNILQSINGGTHLIEDGLKTDNVDVIKMGWNIVKRNQRNMSNLVMDMVSFSKPNEPHRKLQDLNKTIDDAIRHVTEVANKPEVTFMWNPNPKVDSAMYDNALMLRAFENVFKNILDGSRDGSGGVVSVEIQQIDDIARIVIKDDFQVLSDSKLDGLFQPFAFEGEDEVHGIGMAVTQKILREHDGDIAVSRRSKKGIRFVLWLPIVDKDVDLSTGKFKSPKMKKSRKKGSTTSG